MKKVLLTLLTIVVVLGLFAATGFAGYRIGLMRGAQLTAEMRGALIVSIRSVSKPPAGRPDQSLWRRHG